MDGVPRLPRALRPRLAVLFTLAVTGALVLGGALLAFFAFQQFTAAVDAGLTSRASVLVPALTRGDDAALLRDPFALVVTPRARVVAASTSAQGVAAVGGLAPLVSPMRAAAAAGSVDPLLFDSTLHGPTGEVRVLAVALPPDPRVGTPRVLVLGTRLTEVVEAEARLVLLFASAVPFLAAGMAVAGWLLARAALRPVDSLTAEAARLAQDTDLRRRLPQPGTGDEIERLALTLNRMLDRVEATVQREREFVDDAAHELRTPVAVLQGELELAERRFAGGSGDPAAVRESLLLAREEARRLGRLAEDLLLLAEQERQHARSDASVPLLATVREELRRQEAVHPVAVRLDGQEVPVNIDERGVARLLSNLLTNAAAAGARQVQVRVQPEGERARLLVLDDGPGFPDGLTRTATWRFVRGDRARTRGSSGAGLGLAIVSALVETYGGCLRLSNAPGGGALVAVDLPRARPAAGQRERVVAGSPEQSR